MICVGGFSFNITFIFFLLCRIGYGNSHSRTAMPNYWSGPPKRRARWVIRQEIYKNRNLLRRNKEKWRDSFDWSSFFSSSVRCSVLLFFCRFICMMIRRNFHPLSQSGVTMSSAPPGNDPPPWLIWVESHHIVAFLLWGKVDEDSFEWKKKTQLHILKICIAILWYNELVVR